MSQNGAGLTGSSQAVASLKVGELSLTRKESNRAPATIFQGVSFTAPSGSALCISGRSGSGKTSLLAICAGLARPSAGHVSWSDTKVSDLSERHLEIWRSATVSYLDQDSSMIADLRLLENILLGVRRPRKYHVERAMDIMRKLRIEHLAHTRPSRCSGGERQRAGLARALVRQTPLLIVDEPTASLDENNARRVLAALDAARAAGTIIIAATHDDMVLDWADDAVHV